MFLKFSLKRKKYLQIFSTTLTFFLKKFFIKMKIGQKKMSKIAILKKVFEKHLVNVFQSIMLCVKISVKIFCDDTFF